MTVTINGTTGISPVTAAGTSALVDGMTVGRGAGEVSTNTAVGASALAANTTGGLNTAVGNQALAGNTTAQGLTAVGGSALSGSNTGSYNNAFGGSVLAANTSGTENNGFGYWALLSNTIGNDNSAFGEETMRANTTGSYNTAYGAYALRYNSTAARNTAVGYQAGYTNQTGDRNTFVGALAGYTSNVNGAAYNLAVGYEAGYSLTTGLQNTFVGGLDSGYYVTTGTKNTILGNYTGNIAALDIRTASNYVVLSDGDGNPLAWWGIGYTFLPSAYSITTASAANLFVNTDGTLRRSTSALKYKQDIRDIESIDINLLRGVRYKSKSKDDDQTKDHFGVIADEVDAAGIKELVIYGADGEVEGFQYERLTVVLLKSLQELKAEFDAYKAAHP
jgi:hypothetical protein